MKISRRLLRSWSLLGVSLFLLSGKDSLATDASKTPQESTASGGVAVSTHTGDIISQTRNLVGAGKSPETFTRTVNGTTEYCASQKFSDSKKEFQSCLVLDKGVATAASPKYVARIYSVPFTAAGIALIDAGFANAGLVQRFGPTFSNYETRSDAHGQYRFDYKTGRLSGINCGGNKAGCVVTKGPSRLAGPDFSAALKFEFEDGTSEIHYVLIGYPKRTDNFMDGVYLPNQSYMQLPGDYSKVVDAKVTLGCPAAPEVVRLTPNETLPYWADRLSFGGSEVGFEIDDSEKYQSGAVNLPLSINIKTTTTGVFVPSTSGLRNLSSCQSDPN